MQELTEIAAFMRQIESHTSKLAFNTKPFY